MTRTFTEELRTPSGVRLRLCNRSPGALNWLFLPGGPGIGSESLTGLVEAAAVPGSCWLVDLPGDGSNRVEGDAFEHWPQVLLEAVKALPHCVYIGHSTGGMYLQSTPELESRIAGMVLVSTAPDASWHPRYVQMTQENPIAAMDAAVVDFERDPNVQTLRVLAVESAPWNFEPGFVPAGRQLLDAMPYNLEAVQWSDQHFDHVYAHTWWPHALPVLIVSGQRDRIVAQDLWEAAEFQGSNVERHVIAAAGHFPWVENPDAVRVAFAGFSAAAARYAGVEA